LKDESNNYDKLEQKKVKSSNNFKELLFAIVWVYLIVKTFIFDFDVYFINKYFQNYTWLLNYKIFFFLFLIIISKMDYKKFIINFLYFLIFPLLFIFLYIPYKIFKIGKWNGIIAYINIFFRICNNFKIKNYLFERIIRVLL